MNTAEKIYQGVQDFPEPLALEVLHYVEFLRLKNQSSLNQELEQKIQQGIDQANQGVGITIDDDYVNQLNLRVQQRLQIADE
jgi:NADPH-dependent curcumin reductase CurA